MNKKKMSPTAQALLARAKKGDVPYESDTPVHEKKESAAERKREGE